MALDLNDIKRIAHLSRMHLSEEEAAQTLNQLTGFFALVEQMQAVDTAGITPLSHPIEHIQQVQQPLREDRVTEHNQREAYQRPAPATQDGLYLVPKVIE